MVIAGSVRAYDPGVNPFIYANVRDSSQAEVDALNAVCEQLSGFNPDIHLEWVDGFLTSLAAGPVLPPPDEWLPALCGDAFERAFADPDDRHNAQRVLHTRLKVLSEQLDPEALLDEPERLRLSPLMMAWTDADRAKAVEDGAIKAEDAQSLQTGAEWALGFTDGTEAFGARWLQPLGDEGDDTREELMDQVALLFTDPDGDERAELMQRYHPAAPAADADGLPQPSQDDLLNEALFAVQDLRVFWLEHAPKPVTRQVPALPGRNDPCSCGSGKKFKKCHGASV